MRKGRGSATLPTGGFWFIFILERKDSGNAIQFSLIKFSQSLLRPTVCKFLARHRCGKSEVCVGSQVLSLVESESGRT